MGVQHAYTPDSQCFGCGPAAHDGLHLQSMRADGGLEGRTMIDPKYQAGRRVEGWGEGGGRGFSRGGGWEGGCSVRTLGLEEGGGC